jgi:glycosyltransferase involved in cell wall biosynthesis
MAWGSDILLATPLQKLAYRLVVRHADVLIGDSAALVRALEDLGAPPGRTLVLNWGVDLKAFSPPTRDRTEIRGALGLPSGPVIFSPRSLTEVYNPRVILRAFERVADERGDVVLVLKHMGSDAPELGPLRHPDRVRVIGRVAYEEMVDYYRAADVCVSIASSDSSPRSVWEAMGCGAPCILSDLPWVHELIRDGDHALVVPVDEEAVAEAMRRLLTDRPLAQRISVEARLLVEDHRDADTELSRLCAVYERLAAGSANHCTARKAIGALAGAGGVAQALIRRRIRRSDAASTRPR